MVVAIRSIVLLVMEAGSIELASNVIAAGAPMARGDALADSPSDIDRDCGSARQHGCHEPAASKWEVVEEASVQRQAHLRQKGGITRIMLDVP